jgi:pimeloyl-ACP methyl ester carboxylesterase
MDRFVDVPGGRLFVRDEGGGPPVVLLHAAIADHRAWDPVAAGLVETGHRAIAYDLRGYGRSETADVEYSNRADVLAVLDALGIGRAALVGNSRGGTVALDTAIEHPDRVVAVVAVGAGLGGLELPVTPEEEALIAEMDRLETQDPPDVDAIVDLDVQAWVAGPGQPLERVPASVRDLVVEMDRAVNAPGRVHGRPIPLQPPAAQRLAELTCPVLAVAGALDFSDVGATALHLEANAPRSRAVILPDAAHMIGLERPAELVHLITSFVGPLRPWS